MPTPISRVKTTLNGVMIFMESIFDTVEPLYDKHRVSFLSHKLLPFCNFQKKLNIKTML